MAKTTPKKSQHSYPLTQNISDYTEKTLKKVDNAADTVQEQINNYQKPVEDYVQKHPLKALGIALSIGAVLSRILFK